MERLKGWLNAFLMVTLGLVIITLTTVMTTAYIIEEHNHDYIDCRSEAVRVVMSVEGKTIDVYVHDLYQSRNNYKIVTSEGTTYVTDKENCIFYYKE